jgi:cytochrome c-type biogenesis protein CcsB
MFYGPKRIKLPFSVKLRDFQLEYYPGSSSPKSYASEITVIDKDTTFDYRIYMNHVLDYKGYRFFQASYSITPEYERTVLSVNHDFWGTWITYLGYGLLYFGLIMIFFVKGSHFNFLRRRLNEVQEKKKELGFVVALFLGLQSFAQHDSIPKPAGDLNDPEVFTENVLPSVAPDSLAEKFGRLIIQDLDGRMEPVNTYSSALLRKLSKHDTYELPGSGKEITADQALLSMIVLPHIWAYAPVIYLERGDDKLREILGLPEETKYAKLADFFDKEGNYILMPYVEEASKAKIKSKFQKDVQNVDQRVNLLYITLTGRTLRLFPKENDPNNRWYAPVEIPEAGFKEEDALFAGNVLKLVANNILKKDYKSASVFIDAIHNYQQKFGGEILPSEEKVKWELFYNKYDAFRTMFWKLMLVSLLLLTLAIFRIVKRSKRADILIRIIKWLIGLMFLWMVFFLGLRWYISGRAPWSNAYESLIYVALATLLFGLWFGRRSPLTLAASAFVSSVILMVAHWSWMDPEIANLVPVLNSYWLMIHVSIIVASYGPFVLSAVLGFLALLFIIFTNNKNKLRFELTVKELTYINKMSMIVGLVLLTIGNFLGGQWANESWGRYWGWDPKETWALISIMVYALVVHEHIIPALRGVFKLNIMSMFAIWSIMMTYFGVNFYLSGLHSYAKGDPVQTPLSVYIAFVIMVVVSVAAYFRYKKYYEAE